MQKQEPVIKNKFGEKLDTWVESPEGQVKATIIMVHGFGTSKHETAGYFDDISAALTRDGFRVVRFDFSGYGKSEGSPIDVCYTKHIEDLQYITEWVKKNYQEDIYILAQSMGCFITALTLPKNIKKILMTGIPNSDPALIVDRFSERYGNKPGGKIDYNGISLLPRTSGVIQQIGPNFWRDILSLSPVEQVEKLSKITNLKIVHWNQDEVLGTDHLRVYDAISSLNAIWLDGDHSVTNPVDRQNFLLIMLEFFNT